MHDFTDLLNRTGRQSFCPSLAELRIDWRRFLEFQNKAVHNPAIDVLDVILTQDRIDIVVN